MNGPSSNPIKSMTLYNLIFVALPLIFIILLILISR
jgi:hypothetical protein